MTNQFRTEIKLKKGIFPEISYNSKVFLIGSCFSDEIGNKLKASKIECLSNPFGVTYNPISLLNHMKRIVEKNFYSEGDLLKKNDLFNCYHLHSSFDKLDKNEFLDDVNDQIKVSHDFLKKSTHLYVTLGTAWVYELKSNGVIVNNCHKQPANLFEKRMLTVEEVYRACTSIMQMCFSINDRLNIIFNISPVRHLKDGFAENSLSKSTLRVAIGQVEDGDRVFYFPSNEILIDDLRDYRFYDEDLLHPNKIAVDYIWNQIIESQFAKKDVILMKRIEKINAALNHRSFNKKSKENQNFIRETILNIEELQNQYQMINLKEEIKKLKSRLSE